MATLWLLSVGGAAEETIPASTLLDVTDALTGQRRQRRATRLRVVSIFHRGWITILVALLEQAPLPLGTFLPEPWPRVQVSKRIVFCLIRRYSIMSLPEKTYPRKLRERAG